MSEFNISYEELKNILKFTNGFIAGGFALSAFLNNNIETTLIDNNLPKNQDIDIFITIPYTYEHSYRHPWKYIFELGYLPFELLAKQYIKNILESKNYYEDILNDRKRYNNFHTIKNITTKDINEIEYKNSALSHFIKNITTYINNDTKRKIQIIILYDCKIEYFLETFDLNICKLAFMYSYSIDNLDFYHNINNYLKNYDLDLIKNKKMYVNISLYTPNLFKRIIKYISRGYDFIDKNNYENIIVSVNDMKNNIYDIDNMESYFFDKVHNINSDKTYLYRKIEKYIFNNFTSNVITYDNFCKMKIDLNKLD
jgi:hypothetical protein